MDNGDRKNKLTFFLERCVAENDSEKFIDHKLLDGEGILKNTKLKLFVKKWVWPCKAPQGDPTSLKTIIKIILI